LLYLVHLDLHRWVKSI